MRLSLSIGVMFLLVGLVMVPDRLAAAIVINEFICDPQSPLETEWLELFNSSDSAITLVGWQLCDQVDCGAIDTAQIGGGGYLILCQDTALFREFYSDFQGRLAAVQRWRYLNNGGDVIRLLNQSGATLDSVTYLSGNGANRSWERLHADQPGWLDSNWHVFLDQSGASPGKINSVAGGFPAEFSMSIADKMVAVGCTCPNNVLRIELALPGECALTLAVYSVDGRRLKVIYDNQTVVSGEHVYDGRTDDGEFLDVGLYILLGETSGRCNQTRKLVFGVAKP